MCVSSTTTAKMFTDFNDIFWTDRQRDMVAMSNFWQVRDVYEDANKFASSEIIMSKNLSSVFFVHKLASMFHNQLSFVAAISVVKNKKEYMLQRQNYFGFPLAAEDIIFDTELVSKVI